LLFFLVGGAYTQQGLWCVSPKISRRGKTNHSDWDAQEISVENPTSEMAPPWELKKDDKDNLSTAM
jgi:hypothetical protein